MLTEVADGVLLRQSAFCRSNATVVLVDEGLILIDPGIDGPDLEELADDLETLDRPVRAGFATHPHWDHLLWHHRFGVDVPRHATAACVASTRDRMTSLREMTAQYAPSAPIGLLGVIEPLPVGSSQIPTSGGRLWVVEHRAHAPGHAAVLVGSPGVLIAGDMLSDVEIPLLDPTATDPCGDYLAALDLLSASIADDVVALIPGHGAVATGPEIRSRLEADRFYVESILRGLDPDDPRLGPDALYGRDWLPDAHLRNLTLANSRP
jgi:glyoxylase-like metal-dependent hydrolase (beta-lactamase superfamily II)